MQHSYVRIECHQFLFHIIKFLRCGLNFKFSFHYFHSRFARNFWREFYFFALCRGTTLSSNFQYSHFPKRFFFCVPLTSFSSFFSGPAFAMIKTDLFSNDSFKLFPRLLIYEYNICMNIHMCVRMYGIQWRRQSIDGVTYFKQYS